MSFAKIFGSGGKKKEEAPTIQEAIQKLRDTEEMLTKKSEFLEKKIQHELLAAKKAGTKNKKVALAALKRKKRYEKQLTTLDGTVSSIEFQRETLESTSTNVETVKALGYGAKALKNVASQFNVDDVQDILDDISEEMEKSREISDVLSGMGAMLGNDYDDDELFAELEELEEEDLDKEFIGTELPSVPTTQLPEVPTKTKGTKHKVKDDEDMSALEAWAS